MGKNLPTVEIPADAVLEEVYEEGLLGGTMNHPHQGNQTRHGSLGKRALPGKTPGEDSRGAEVYPLLFMG